MKAKFILLVRTSGQKSFLMRLTEGGKKVYKAINPPFTIKEWNYDPKKRKNELKEVKHKPNGTPEDTILYNAYVENKKWIETQEEQYNSAINKLINVGNPFSFNTVFMVLDGENTTEEIPNTVHKLYKHIIKELRDKNKFGNAAAYNSSFGRFKNFRKKDLLIHEVNKKLLEDYKTNMEGLSTSTISIHLRNLRAVYNYALKNGVVKYDLYPFRNNDIFKSLKGNKRSIALNKSEIDQIRLNRKQIEEGSPLWHSYNYFLFGYAAWGINFQDMARLQWNDTKNGRITYIRYKTRGKIQTQISPPITEELKEILNWYRTNNRQIGKIKNEYIFPILNTSHETEQKKFNRINKIRKELNKDIKTIVKEVNEDVTASTYTWRHSMASISKNELMLPIEMISQMLGHSSISTTQGYLAQFPDYQIDKAASGL